MTRHAGLGEDKAIFVLLENYFICQPCSIHHFILRQNLAGQQKPTHPSCRDHVCRGDKKFKEKYYAGALLNSTNALRTMEVQRQWITLKLKKIIIEW